MKPRRAIGAETGARDVATSEFQTLTSEADEDRKGLRIATATALLLHAFLFLIHLPSFEKPVLAEPEKQTFIVMKPPRFIPPEVHMTDPILEPRKHKVPIPDPDPEELEPLRVLANIEPELDLPDTDYLIGLPESPPPPMPTGPMIMTPDVMPPIKTYAPNPKYTEAARKARIQGVVIVQAIIDREGRVSQAEILKSLPMGLDESSLETVQQWRFDPATLDGKPVSVYYTLTIKFSLT